MGTSGTGHPGARSAPRPIRRRGRHRMVATQKLAKDDLVSRVAAKIFRPGRTEAARELRYGRQEPLLSSRACRRPVMNRQSLLDNPAPAPAPLLMEIAGRPRNGLEGGRERCFSLPARSLSSASGFRRGRRRLLRRSRRNCVKPLQSLGVSKPHRQPETTTFSRPDAVRATPRPPLPSQGTP
jgi:hypothetical protein